MPDTYPQGADPATEMYLIAPSDTEDLARPVRALFIETAGNLAFIDDVGNELIIAVSAGVLPFRPKRVKVATTAVVYGMR